MCVRCKTGEDRAREREREAAGPREGITIIENASVGEFLSRDARVRNGARILRPIIDAYASATAKDPPHGTTVPGICMKY